MDSSVASEEETEGWSLPSDRRRAALYTLPFFALGTLNVVLMIWWGLELVWLFAMLPPVLFMSALAWVAFETGMLEDR